jgi:hypothetical protein
MIVVSMVSSCPAADDLDRELVVGGECERRFEV